MIVVQVQQIVCFSALFLYSPTVFERSRSGVFRFEVENIQNSQTTRGLYRSQNSNELNVSTHAIFFDLARGVGLENVYFGADSGTARDVQLENLYELRLAEGIKHFEYCCTIGYHVFGLA